METNIPGQLRTTPYMARCSIPFARTSACLFCRQARTRAVKYDTDLTTLARRQSESVIPHIWLQHRASDNVIKPAHDIQTRTHRKGEAHTSERALFDMTI